LFDPNRADEVFELLAKLMEDPSESAFLRDSAGNLLLDFQVARFQPQLTAYARERKQRPRSHPLDIVAFTESTIATAFSGEPSIRRYRAISASLSALNSGQSVEGRSWSAHRGIVPHCRRTG